MIVDNQTNIDVYKFSLLFEDHLNAIYDSVTGYKSLLTQSKDDPSTFYLSREKRPGAVPICNESGGEFLVGELRKAIYNRHTAMATLTQDEIADVCADAIMAPIDTMMFYADRYQIKDLVMIETIGLDIESGAYSFLTSLRGGELRKMGVSMTTINVIQRHQEQQVQQTKGLLG